MGLTHRIVAAVSAVAVLAVGLTTAPAASAETPAPDQVATGTVTGVVRGPDASPLATDQGQVLLYADTGAEDDTVGGVPSPFLVDGGFTLDGVAPGDYWLEFLDHSGTYAWTYAGGYGFEHRTHVTVVADAVTTQDLTVDLAGPQGTVHGTVTGVDGLPVEDFSIDVLDTAGTYVGRSIATAADGTYTIEHLPVGSYVVKFYDAYDHVLPDVYSGGSATLADATPVVVTDDSTTTVDAVVGGEHPDVPTTATVTGTVHGLGGTPLAGAVVTDWTWDDTSSTWKARTSTTTGEDGTYGFTELTPGNHRIGFAGPAGSAYVAQFHPGAATVAAATTLTLTAGDHVSADATLTASARLTGKAISSTGAGIAGVRVQVWAQEGTTWTAVRSTTTTSTGTYALEGLAAGTYRVGFSGSAYVTQFYPAKATVEAATSVVLPAGGTTSSINARLVAGAKVSGKVTDAAGRAVAGVTVQLYGRDAAGTSWVATRTATTGTTGTYAISGLAAGTYRIGFSDPTAPTRYLPQFYPGATSLASATTLTLGVGQAVAAVDAKVVAAAKVTGKVIDASGAAVAGVVVQLYVRSSTGTAWSASSKTTTSASGTYTAAGLRAGTYTARFTAPTPGRYLTQYFSAKPSLTTATTFTLATGATRTAVDAKLVSAATLAGTVTDATGSALAGVAVRLYQPGTTAGTWTAGTAVSTDASGAYRFTGLAAGTYRVGFTAGTAGDFLAQFYPGAASVTVATTLTLAPGATSDAVDATLVAGASITGHARSSADAAVAGLPVRVERRQGTSTAWSTAATTTTATDGSYTVRGLTAGTYRVRFGTPGAAGYLTQYHPGVATADEADPVVLTAGAHASGIDAALVAAASISGTVKNTAGAAVSGIRVTVHSVSEDDEYGAYVGSATTSTTGAWTVHGLAAGPYRVLFDDAAARPTYVDQYYPGKLTLEAGTTLTLAVGAAKTGINATLVVGGTISGKVTTPTGAGAATVRVTAYRWDATYAYWHPVAEAMTSSTGAYTVAGVPSGTYRVGFSDEAYPRRYVDQYHPGKATVDAATSFTLAAGAARSGVDARLVAGAQVTGKVTNAAGNGVAGISVNILTPVTSGSMSYWSYVAYATTRSDGTYAVGGLPAGTYRVRFSPGSASTQVYVPQYYPAKSTVEAATSLTLAAGAAKTGVNATLVTGGTVTGTVTDADGAALPGIQVVAYGAGQSWVTSTVTAADGTYSVTGLAAGAYRFAFTDNDRPSTYVSRYYPAAPTYSTALPVDVSTAAKVTGVDMTLEVGASVTGTVTSTAGTPLSGIQVTVHRESTTGTSTYWQTVGYASTGTDGTYTVGGLATGVYRIGFQDPSSAGTYVTQFVGGGSDVATATDVPLTAGETYDGVDAALVKAARITGKVTDATGAARSGISVQVYALRGSGTMTYWTTVRSGSTGTDGTYSVGGLEAGTYRVGFSDYSSSATYLTQYYPAKATVDAGTSIVLAAAGVRTGVNATLVVGSTLSGTVTNAAGTGIGSVTVTAYRWNAAFGYWATVRSAATSSTGTYTVTGLPAGEYRVGFQSTKYVPQYHPGKATLATATTLTVGTAVAKTGVDARLVVGATLTGTVTNAAGAGVPSVNVTVYAPVTTGTATSWSSVAWATTAADGTYSVGGLAAGTYRVGFTAPGSYVAQYYPGKATLETATSLTLAAGATRTGTGAVLVAGSSVRGTVRDTEGAGVPGIWVSVYRQAGSAELPYWSTVASAVTAADGTYAVTGLGAGTYRVGFRDGSTSPSRMVDQFYGPASSVEAATSLVVAAGATLDGIDAEMTPGASMSGTVTDAEGSPLPDVYVTVSTRTESGWEPVAYSWTGDDGTYRVTGLTAGDHVVQLQTWSASESYLTQYYGGAFGVEDATVLTLTAGTETSGVDVQLVRAAALAGSVTDDAGTPLGEVLVTAHRMSGTGPDAETLSSQGVWTQSDGSYVIDELTPGTYRVEFSDWTGLHVGRFHGGASTLEDAESLTLTGGTTTQIDAALVAVDAALVPDAV